jgi:hypothetical protein
MREICSGMEMQINTRLRSNKYLTTKFDVLLNGAMTLKIENLPYQMISLNRTFRELL